MRTAPDELILLLARHQEGVVTTAQAVALGLTRDQVRQRARSVRWDRLGGGVLGVPGQPPSWQRDLMAMWLRADARAVVSHEWAARLIGLEGVSLPDRPRLLVPRGARDTIGSVRLHSTRSLHAVDRTTVRRPLPKTIRQDRRLRRARIVRTFVCTSASRTVIDLAAEVDDATLGRLVDSACRTGGSSPAYLARRVEALRKPGRSGPTLVEQALIDAGGHSLLERRFLAAVRRAGLPRPATQVTYLTGGRFLARVDFDFAPHPLVVEVSGRRGHSSDADRARDAHRRNELQLIGISVVEFTYARVVGDAPGVTAEVAAHLGLQTT